MKAIIGIDPGASGGVSLVNNNGILANFAVCPDTPRKMHKIIKLFNTSDDDISHWLDASNIKCYIENVWAFPTDMRSSAFKFGKNFGMWLGILAANNIDTVLVTPQVWQKHYGEFPKNKKDRKNKLKEIASNLSGEKATLATADSILIAYYGYETEKEEISE